MLLQQSSAELMQSAAEYWILAKCVALYIHQPPFLPIGLQEYRLSVTPTITGEVNKPLGVKRGQGLIWCMHRSPHEPEHPLRCTHQISCLCSKRNCMGVLCWMLIDVAAAINRTKQYIMRCMHLVTLFTTPFKLQWMQFEQCVLTSTLVTVYQPHPQTLHNTFTMQPHPQS